MEMDRHCVRFFGSVCTTNSMRSGRWRPGSSMKTWRLVTRNSFGLRSKKKPDPAVSRRSPANVEIRVTDISSGSATCTPRLVGAELRLMLDRPTVTLPREALAGLDVAQNASTGDLMDENEARVMKDQHSRDEAEMRRAQQRSAGTGHLPVEAYPQQ